MFHNNLTCTLFKKCSISYLFSFSKLKIVSRGRFRAWYAFSAYPLCLWLPNCASFSQQLVHYRNTAIWSFRTKRPTSVYYLSLRKIGTILTPIPCLLRLWDIQQVLHTRWMPGGCKISNRSDYILSYAAAGRSLQGPFGGWTQHFNSHIKPLYCQR